MNPADLSGPILIVEDDRNTAALVSTYLQRERFATLEVHDGAQALETAQQEKPGFVILDVMLPGMDGWEICRGVTGVGPSQLIDF
jgi:DNA-binding response OmpR family regulator